MVDPQDFCVSLWHFDNGASSKIDDVLAEDGRLLNVLLWIYWGWNWVGLGRDWVWGDLGLKGWGLGLDNQPDFYIKVDSYNRFWLLF